MRIAYLLRRAARRRRVGRLQREIVQGIRNLRLQPGVANAALHRVGKPLAVGGRQSDGVGDIAVPIDLGVIEHLECSG